MSKPQTEGKLSRRVLSIDGGGIRGIIPAMVVAHIERKLGKPAHELFDLMVGTSIRFGSTKFRSCPARLIPSQSKALSARLMKITAAPQGLFCSVSHRMTGFGAKASSYLTRKLPGAY